MRLRTVLGAATLLAAMTIQPAGAVPVYRCVAVEGVPGSTCNLVVQGVRNAATGTIDLTFEVGGPFECSYAGEQFTTVHHATVADGPSVVVDVDCKPVVALAARCNMVGIGLLAIGTGSVAGVSRCKSLAADCGVGVNQSVDFCVDTAFGFSRTPWSCSLWLGPPTGFMVFGLVCWWS